MKIGIDVDGVLRNLYDKLIEVYLRENPDEWCRPVEEWNKYNISDKFSIGSRIYDFWFNSKYTQEIYLKSTSFPGIDIIDEISKKNEIEIITHQPNLRTDYYTLHWIQSMKIPYHGLHFTKDKWAVECDVYVDDSPEQIDNLLNRGKEVVVVDWPWNKNGKDGSFDGAVTRVKDFYKFGEMVMKGKI